jgi:uncharacterized protein YeaO (DUF488 family)
MSWRFRTVQLGTPRSPGEGLRIGTVRHLPRGVRKEDYARLDYFDLWLPILAPSRELLGSFQRGEIPLATLFRRYRREMQQTEAKQVIGLLAALASQTSLSVGCYCPDETQCHRSILGEMVRAAARQRGEP